MKTPITAFAEMEGKTISGVSKPHYHTALISFTDGTFIALEAHGERDDIYLEALEGDEAIEWALSLGPTATALGICTMEERRAWEEEQSRQAKEYREACERKEYERLKRKFEGR
jgi:hypothetical protein